MLALSFLAFRSISSDRLRTTVLIAAVALGVTALCAVQLTNDAIARGLERAWRASVGQAQLQVRTFAGSGFSADSIARVQSLPGVTAVAPLTRKWVFFRTVSERGFVEIIGLDPVLEPQVRTYRTESGRFLSSDRPNGVVTRAAWAKERGLKVGDSFELITRDGLTDFELIGVLESDEAGLATYGATVLVPLQTARGQFGMEERISSLSLLLNAATPARTVRQALSGAIPESHVVRSAEDVRREIERSVVELQASLAFFGATALFVALFLIYNTIEMTVVSQTQQTGRLRAAGATRGQVFLYFIEHGLIPGSVGSALGSLLGYFTALLLATMVERTQDVAVAPIAFSVPTIVASAIIGMVAVTLASLAPALRATRIDPIEMIRLDETEQSHVGWRLVGLGFILILVSTLAFLGPATGASSRILHTVAIFPLLAGIVLVSRLAVRPLARILAIPTNLLGRGAERLAVRNLDRHVGRTVLTVAGFMVSLSLLIGLAALAQSSVRSGEDWTHALVPGDHVVISPVDQPPTFVAEFAKLPGVERASPVSFFSTQSANLLLQVAALEPSTFLPGLEMVEGTRGAARSAMEQGGAVLIPRRFASERGLHVGDAIEMQARSGPQQFAVAGVIANSFPSPDGARTLMMSRADAERHFGNRTFRLIMIQAAATASAGPVQIAVAELAERYGMSSTTANAISEQVALAVWRLLALLGALVGIGLVVATFGTANTMMMNAAERSYELNVLWAAGMSRAQVQRMTMVEAIMMGLIGGVLGTIIGALMAWILISLARTSGFTPEYVFPLPAAVGGIVVTLIASALAALIPSYRAGRLEAR